MRISKIIIKWFLIAAGLGLVGTFGIWVFSDKTYTKKDLIDNYKLKQTELAELKKYLKKLLHEWARCATFWGPVQRLG